MRIDVHRGEDVPPIASLADVADREGLALVRRTIDEWESGANRFDEWGACFALGVDGSTVVGMCGVNRDPYLDDPTVARLRHLYVVPRSRRSGVGSALVRWSVDRSRPYFDRIRLRTFDAGANAFYRTIGFVATAEGDATHELVLRH